MTAVSLDTASAKQGNGTTQTSLSWSHTVASSANGLVVALAAVTNQSGNRFATAVTYNSVAMSSLTSYSVVASLSGQTVMGELWYLANPATGANTVSATFGNSVRCDGFGASFLNVSGASATGAPSSWYSGTGTTASATTINTSGANDYVLAACATNGDGSGGPTLSVTANNQTLSAWTGTRAGTSGDAIGGIDTAQATGTASGMSVILSSSRSWIIGGVALLAAAGGGGGGGGSTGTGSFFYFRRRRYT